MGKVAPQARVAQQAIQGLPVEAVDEGGRVSAVQRGQRELAGQVRAPRGHRATQGLRGRVIPEIQAQRGRQVARETPGLQGMRDQLDRRV